MEIEAKEFIVKMTHNELWSTAWDIRYALEASLKSHWINHQDNWIKQEEHRLKRLEDMFVHLGRVDLYKDVFTIAVGAFEEFNTKKFNNV